MSNTTRSLALLAVLSFATVSSGCFRYGVSTQVPSDGLVRQQRGPVLAWGLAGQDRLAPECTAGVARSESYMPWWGGVVTFLTLGIVAPWRVDYECAAGSAGTAATPAPAQADAL